MHTKQQAADTPQYWVMAKVCEPKYEDERKFVAAEVAFAERRIAKHKESAFRWVSLPAFGVFHHKAWREYIHSLKHYEQQLGKYQDEVAAGVLPVKFAVQNAADEADAQVKIRVQVKDGRVDVDKKVPERPERLDGRGKHTKISWPKVGGFSRSEIKITPHAIVAKFSTLGSNDGAVLVNQLVHLHCGPDTEVTYYITSLNVVHESGEVELHEN